MKNILFILSLLLVSAAHAEDRTFQFGIMPVISIFNVTDPYGATESANSFNYISGVMIVSTGRDSRIFADVIYDKFSLGATQSKTGQDVTRTEGSISYQSLLRIARDWKPWAGIGLGAGSEGYKSRYILSPGGFSIFVNPAERSVNALYLIFNLSSEWQLNKSWNMGVHLKYEQPTGDGTKALRLGMYFVF